MAGQVTGAADWHINADEPDVVDYDTTFKPPEQDALQVAELVEGEQRVVLPRPESCSLMP